jgi:hypothetical protein
LKAKKNKKKGTTGGGMRLKKEASKPVAMPATIDDDLFADLDDFGFGEPADTPPQDNTAMEADGWGDMDLDFAAEPAVVTVKPIATPLKKKPLGRKKLVKKSATKKKKPITKRPVLLSPSTKSKTLNAQKKDANTIDDWESFLQ